MNEDFLRSMAEDFKRREAKGLAKPKGYYELRIGDISPSEEEAYDHGVWQYLNLANRMGLHGRKMTHLERSGDRTHYRVHWKKVTGPEDL